MRKKTGEPAQVVDPEVRYFPGAVPLEVLALPQNSGSSALERVRNEVAPVLARAGISEEHFPNGEVPAVDGEPGHAGPLRGEPSLDVFDLITHT
jgi:hypothetical protein